MQWIFPDPCDEERCRSLARALGAPLFVAELLCRRGFSEPEEASRFLDPRLRDLADPFQLPQVAAAVERILLAVDRGERIVLYGDYDVDGVTSVAFLCRALRAYGADPQCFLPLRAAEGYGLSADGVARCLEMFSPQLLMAVDCGTTSVAEIRTLREKGVDVIVVDHHEPQAPLPECHALVNPKVSVGWHYLCSVGLAFKLVHALLKRRPVAGFDLRHLLDLVALGTVADIAPLEGENRTLVRSGLARLGQSRWPGIRALISVAALTPPLRAVDIAFRLGPRLNAAGRLAAAEDALALLLTDNAAEAALLAEKLDAQNRERRSVEDLVLSQAERQLEGTFSADRDLAIVVGDLGWHPGVIGIVASRLQKRYHRPVIVVAFGEDGRGKGSGRSIAGFSLVRALGGCAHLLEKHGGHEMAAGLSVQSAQFEAFRLAFQECVGRELCHDQLVPKLLLDAELSLREIDEGLLDAYGSLEPFGSGNLQPAFFARGVTPSSQPRVVKEKHLSLSVRQGRVEKRCIWFGAASERLPAAPWDIAFTLERDEYQGVVRPQMQIRAVRASSC